jgi:hypothetical protein
MPASTVVLSNNADACQEMEGFHSETSANGFPIMYAVVLQCSGSDLDLITDVASHEMAEAALDPLINTAPAWVGLDEDHLAYDVMMGFNDENGDLCVGTTDEELASTEPALSGITVQRQWSNTSAGAGHDPCVQQAGFFIPSNVSRTGRTKGILLPASGTAQIELGLFSDAPTDAWTLSASEADPGVGYRTDVTSNPTVEVTLDKTSGKNGDRVQLSVRRIGRNSLGTALVIVTSTLGAARHSMPLLVSGL